MTKYFYIALAALAGSVAMTSCNDGGSKDGETGPIKSFTITADKTQAEANGEDVVTFMVKDQDGNDITAIDKMRILCEQDNSGVTGAKTTSYMGGEMTYIARYDGNASTNKATVKYINRSKYEKYFRQVALFEQTGTWCVNCPTMHKTMTKLQTEQMPGRTVLLAFHSNGGSVMDPFAIEATDKLCELFKNYSFPAVTIDMRLNLNQTSSVALDILAGVKESIAKYPATCGIKIATTLDKSTRLLTISPEIALEKEGEYAMGWAISVDGLIYPQVSGGSTIEKYEHKHIVRKISDFYGSNQNMGKQAANATWVPKAPITTTLENEASYPFEKTSVIVFVLKKEADGKMYINNIASAKIGENLDYKLND